MAKAKPPALEARELVTVAHYDPDAAEVTAIEVIEAPQEIHITERFFSEYDDRFVDHDPERGEWTFGTISPATYRQTGVLKGRGVRVFELVRWDQ